RRRAAAIYELVRAPFIEQPLPGRLGWLSPQALLKLGRIDAGRTLWKALAHDFPDTRLRQLFGRYATYNGSSPFRAPATLPVIIHVELAYGIFAVEGGIYRLAEALAERARALGVEIATATEVVEVLAEERGSGACAVGVRLGGGASERADLVVANCEASY